jgi:acetylornithine deacetylase/succinyl-diaminopimelate desuccinylase-like protein
MLLDRIEDAATGELLLPELRADIPDDRVAQAGVTAAEFPIGGHFPFVDGARPAVDDAVEQLLARTWRGSLSVVGASGLPLPESAGNVLRPFTTLQLSLRLPPTCDPDRAIAAVERALTTDPPYGARVSFRHPQAGPGWNAPSFAPWLQDALDRASTATFGRPSAAFGEGGSIPFMGMLGERFPDAQFVITGVLGPGTNAHGPNEYLHLPTARRLTTALASILADHAIRHP